LRGNRRVSFGTFSLTLMSSTVVRRSNPSLRAALRLALLFAAVKLLLQFTLTLWTQHIGYSYFRDEFYYIACGRHLAWGFVDHGPIVALQARLGEPLFGDSLFAIRILSALAGAATVFLTGLLAWALGGLRPTQALATTGSLSRASTPNTHSCTRRKGSRRMNLFRASIPSANSRLANELFAPTALERKRSRFRSEVRMLNSHLELKNHLSRGIFTEPLFSN
jgi:hypothetical protein